jgi:hypothetical protein
MSMTALARRIAFVFHQVALEKAALEENSALIKDADNGRA